MSVLAGRRRAGMLIPLFSCPSSTSWGIGDIGDVKLLTEWLAGCGLRVVQLLPLNEMAAGQQSPYSAISAMAIDPIFISVADVPEFRAAGGEPSLSESDAADLARVRQSPRVDFATVRALKNRALTNAFDRFQKDEWCRDTTRARQMRAFRAEQAWWVDDYALFRALHAREHHRAWTEWPEPLQRREPGAMETARRELERDVLFFEYLQWIADEQWRDARTAAHERGVELFGDLPFMVDGHSADVWAHQHQFDLDSSVGVPPDAFSATGQDWGMPVYRWDVIAADNFGWLRDRARRSAALYDGYRVDHLVGFYRTYSRPRQGGEPVFTPSDEATQLALGERLLTIFREPGAEIIAEDLGTVPDFVRASLSRLSVPGFRVFRWERFWHVKGQPFRDPTEYPPASVATSGTHDTEPLAVWWESASAEERAAVGSLPTIRQLMNGAEIIDDPYIPRVRDVLLEALFASGSELVLIAVQDVFGWRDRINEPATVTDENWTFRLPWPIDRLPQVPDVRARQQTLHVWAERYNRT